MQIRVLLFLIGVSGLRGQAAFYYHLPILSRNQLSHPNGFLNPELSGCFLRFPNCLLVRVQPAERRYGISAEQCATLCASPNYVHACRSFVYQNYQNSCDLFALKAQDPPAGAWNSPGYDYYEVVPNCLPGSITQVILDPDGPKNQPQIPTEIRTMTSKPAIPSTTTATPTTTELRRFLSSFPPRRRGTRRQIPWNRRVTTTTTEAPDIELTDYPLPPDYWSSYPDTGQDAYVYGLTPKVEEEKEKHPVPFATDNRLSSLYCRSGRKPLFLKAVGFESLPRAGTDYIMPAEGLLFDNIAEEDCLTACLADMTPTGVPFECVAFDFNSNRKACRFRTEAQASRNEVITTNRRNVLYEKLCILDDLTEKCRKPVVERFPQMILIGYNERGITVDSVQMCLENCLDSYERLGFQCRSGMFFGSSVNKEDNCLLNTEDHAAQPELFVKESVEPVEYFSVSNCYLKTLKQFRMAAKKSSISSIRRSKPVEYFSNYVKIKFDNPTAEKVGEQIIQNHQIDEAPNTLNNYYTPTTTTTTTTYQPPHISKSYEKTTQEKLNMFENWIMKFFQ